MRWWLNTDDPQIFSVDNASVSGMDFSGLPAELYHVQWTDGRGELETQVDPLTNDNGLRETFIDVAPYAPLFQQFLAKLPRLTLGQAQQVQTDLIKQLFESKRQEPFHYTVAAGDFWWDASDEALYSSPGALAQNSLALSNVVAQLNAVIPALIANDTSLASDGDALVAHLNNKVIGPGVTTIMNNLLSSGGVAAPGFGDAYGTMPHSTVSFALGALTWIALPATVTSSMQWIPIGGTTAVPVTPAEQTAILNGIAARTNTLAGKKNTKVAEVKALTAIPDVIAYDVTTGW